MGILAELKKWLYESEEPDEPVQGDDKNKDSQLDFQKEENFENLDSVILIAKPRSFKDSLLLSKQIKKGRAIMLSLEYMIPEEKQRLLDFISGVVMAKDGMIAKVYNNVYVCSADNVGILNLTQEEIGK